jgi:hypothetical protein
MQTGTNGHRRSLWIRDDRGVGGGGANGPWQKMRRAMVWGAFRLVSEQWVSVVCGLGWDLGSQGAQDAGFYLFSESRLGISRHRPGKTVPK